MSGSMPGEDPQETARALQGALEGMTRQLAQVKATVRRGKWVIAALAVSFCLDLLITAGFGYNTVRVNDTQNASHANQISACRQANVNRAQDVAIWNQFLADLAPPPARTAKVRAELGGINRLIRVKDKPRNCTALYRLSSGAAAPAGQ